MRSPVSRIPLGEHNAIRSRGLGGREFTFDSKLGNLRSNGAESDRRTRSQFSLKQNPSAALWGNTYFLPICVAIYRCSCFRPAPVNVVVIRQAIGKLMNEPGIRESDKVRPIQDLSSVKVRD
jgi:hypothetical protein